MELQVIWHTMTPVWCHSNGAVYMIFGKYYTLLEDD